jgi:single-strand DNA-binding protein
MSGLNKAILVGNLGRDPEMRFTPDGIGVTDFSLAVSEGKSDTVWFRISCWRGLAELTNKYLRKGQQVYVEGRLRPREYEGQDGKRRFTLDVVAEKVVFLGHKPENEHDIPVGGVSDEIPEDISHLDAELPRRDNGVGLAVQPEAEAVVGGDGNSLGE